MLQTSLFPPTFKYTKNNEPEGIEDYLHQRNVCSEKETWYVLTLSREHAALLNHTLLA